MSPEEFNRWGRAIVCLVVVSAFVIPMLAFGVAVAVSIVKSAWNRP